MKSKNKNKNNFIDVGKIIPKKLNLSNIKLPEIISIDQTKKNLGIYIGNTN